MWEKISKGAYSEGGAYIESHRLKVPGGWIVRTVVFGYDAGAHSVQTFVTDQNYDWKLEPAS